MEKEAEQVPPPAPPPTAAMDDEASYQARMIELNERANHLLPGGGAKVEKLPAAPEPVTPESAPPTPLESVSAPSPPPPVPLTKLIRQDSTAVGAVAGQDRGAVPAVTSSSPATAKILEDEVEVEPEEEVEPVALVQAAIPEPMSEPEPETRPELAAHAEKTSQRALHAAVAADSTPPSTPAAAKAAKVAAAAVAVAEEAQRQLVRAHTDENLMFLDDQRKGQEGEFCMKPKR